MYGFGAYLPMPVLDPVTIATCLGSDRESIALKQEWLRNPRKESANYLEEWCRRKLRGADPMSLHAYHSDACCSQPSFRDNTFLIPCLGEFTPPPPTISFHGPPTGASLRVKLWLESSDRTLLKVYKKRKKNSRLISRLA